MNTKHKLLSDLIPITAHYDTSMLITKNGELVQILSVNGFSKRFDKNQDLNLRADMRKTLKALLSKDIMFYLYVKRDYQYIEISKDIKSISAIKHEIWLKSNGLELNLMNTLYIAVVHIGAKMLFSQFAIAQQFFFKKIQNRAIQRLAHCAEEISHISMEILQSLEKYGIKLLSLVAKEDKLISEPLSFIYYLMHFHERDIEVKKVDFAKILSYNLQIHNGYNTSEFIINDGLNIDLEGNVEELEKNIVSHNISMLNLKSGYNLPINYTDQILNLNHRMIICETIKLNRDNAFVEKIRTDRKLYELMAFKTGINLSDIILQDYDQTISSQISLMITGQSKNDLFLNLNNTTNLFAQLGIASYIEDLYISGSFFSILPGNSHLLRREFTHTINNSCIFTSIKQESLGGYNGSIWGEPITIFKTTDNLPFFFNFHNKDNIGHTIIVGQEVKDLNILVSLLIYESLKLDPIIIDLFSDDIDLELLYNELNKDTTQDKPSINLAKAVDYNIAEFYKILEFIIFQKEVLSQEIKEQIYNFLEQLITHLQTEIQIESILTIINNTISTTIMNTDIQNLLLEFFSIDIYFKYFYADVLTKKKFFKTNINQILPDIHYKDQVITVLTFFIMKKISQEIDQHNTTPIIINISSYILSLAPIYKSNIIALLNELSIKHAIVIFNCTARKTLYNINGISEILRDTISVKIFLSDKFIDREFKSIFDLSYFEINKIKMYEPSEKIFLIKQDTYSITSSFKTLTLPNQTI